MPNGAQCNQFKTTIGKKTQRTRPIYYSVMASVISVYDLSLSPRIPRAEQYPVCAAQASRGR